METAIKKLQILLEKVDKESIERLNNALNQVLTDENQKIKLKIGYAIGNENDKGNYLSLDFRIV
jgi:hypothetical protein